MSTCRFNRQSDAALERHIEEVWTARVSKEPWLFNGAKFRLHSFHLAPPPGLPSAAESSGRTASCQDSTGGERSFGAPARVLTLRVGLTSYKDYLGTNWSWRVEELCRRGEADFSSRQALLAQPLGVGAVMCTSDGQVVLIRRSQKVAEAGGKLDIPGGHPEPKAVCQSLGEENINMTLLEKSPEAVVSELFSSVCAEIRDEVGPRQTAEVHRALLQIVNVPLSSLGEPVLMGVARNHSSAGRPSIEFHVSCALSSAEVKELYWKGGAEANESTDIVFLSTAEVLGLDSSSPLWSELCPSAKGAVLLYQTVTPHA
ncbi:uridine diphosphate glucose pyrophosphatase NUDT22 [Nerophis ophidion]|uniref:uridine diphosphate glucose pyrophosphatase NUDT22 n=1 Tax=Nerophis ophidion TaxID=159077 RepID=UPI002AE02AE3|nr:uridine diphosphate glucose pyrophosphatase NUDT22 [Nerophis ophidion]